MTPLTTPGLAKVGLIFEQNIQCVHCFARQKIMVYLRWKTVLICVQTAFFGRWLGAWAITTFDDYRPVSLRVRSVKLWSMLYTIMFLDIWATITFWIACVASVSVRFRNKERGPRVKDHAINNSLNFSRDQNRKSPSSFYSETKRKRLLRRPHSEGLISGLLLRGEGRGFPRLLPRGGGGTRRKIG